MTNLFRSCLLLAFIPVLAGAAPDKLGSLAPYLMDRQAEIALARSAAPASISKDATVLVLTSHGYVTTANGSNGFSCFVERGWAQPFDQAPFWNPRIRAPQCLNRAASDSVLLYSLKRTQLALGGATREEIQASLTSGVANGSLPVPQPGAVSYMMSKQQYLGDFHHPAWFPHVMFFGPKADGADSGAAWGADKLRSPLIVDDQHKAVPEPWTTFMIPVSHWSDGSPAPLYSGT